jgi:hypothetical protein
MYLLKLRALLIRYLMENPFLFQEESYYSTISLLSSRIFRPVNRLFHKVILKMLFTRDSMITLKPTIHRYFKIHYSNCKVQNKSLLSSRKSKISYISVLLDMLQKFSMDASRWLLHSLVEWDILYSFNTLGR